MLIDEYCFSMIHSECINDEKTVDIYNGVCIDHDISRF